MTRATPDPHTAKCRFCYVVASEITAAAFLKDHISTLIENGYEVTLAANFSSDRILPFKDLNLKYHSVDIPRRISPLRDLRALINLVALFRNAQFEFVHSVSPKAGLLGMLSSYLAAVPKRVHTFTGQVWVTRRGISRWTLRQLDRLVAMLATRSLVDSHSQYKYLISEGVIKPHRAEVIGNGAICGLDDSRFKPSSDIRKSVRSRLGIPEHAPVLLFVGRLVRDKGVLDLSRAFCELSKKCPSVRIIFVGPDEDGVANEMNLVLSKHLSFVHFIGLSESPESFMAAADVFCMPSYREGFGMAIIESAAVGLPTVASRIYGITDAVVDGQTGLLHPVGDVDAIVRLVLTLIQDSNYRHLLARQARSRALALYSRHEICRLLIEFYQKL